MLNQFAINDPMFRQEGLSMLLQSLLNPLDNGLQDYINPYSSLISEILRTISDRQPIGDRTQGDLGLNRSPSIRTGVTSRSVPGELAPSFVGAPNRGFDVNTLFPGFPRSSVPSGVSIPIAQRDSAFPVRGNIDPREQFLQDLVSGRNRQNQIGGIIPYGL